MWLDLVLRGRRKRWERIVFQLWQSALTSFSSNFQDVVHARLWTSTTLWMLLCNVHVKHLPRRSACYAATTISINFQAVLRAMLQHPYQASSKTLWMLRCNIRFKQLLCSGWYVATSISSIFQDVLHATLRQPFQSTSKLFCVLCCNIRIKHLPRRSGCYVVTSLPVTSKTFWMLRCNIHFKSLDATLNVQFNELQNLFCVLRCNIHAN